MWLLSSQTQKRAALTCLFSSKAETVFGVFALCQGAFALWSPGPRGDLSALPPSISCFCRYPVQQLRPPRSFGASLRTQRAWQRSGLAFGTNELLRTYTYAFWERLSFTMVRGGAGRGQE